MVLLSKQIPNLATSHRQTANFPIYASAPYHLDHNSPDAAP